MWRWLVSSWDQDRRAPAPRLSRSAHATVCFMGRPATAPSPVTFRSARLSIAHLIRPHWKALTLALIAVIGETVTDILEPWPIKIVVDNVLQGKKLTGAL